MHSVAATRPLPFDPELCLVRSVMAEIGEKWSILVLTDLRAGSRRFSEIKRAIGDISQRMLTQTPRRLQRNGFVRRAVTPSIPPRVDYELTPLGIGLVAALAPLARWSLDHRAEVTGARAVFDAL